jgi:hypothetical protein
VTINVLLPQSWTMRSDPDVVERVVRALHDHPGTRQALHPVSPGQPAYVRLSDLGGRPPPPGVPFLNEAVGVLSVPTPRGGASEVEAALRGVAPPGTRVEAA